MLNLSEKMLSMNTKILFKKLKRNVEDHNLLVSLKKAFSYLLMPIYTQKVYRIYGIDLEQLTLKQIVDNHFTFKILYKTDGNIMRQIEEMEEWLTGKMASKIASQALCLVALDRNRVAGFNLVSFGDVYIPLINQRKNFGPHEAWSEQITVHKYYRRRGLASQLRYRVFNELKKKGIKSLYGGTLCSNEPSLKLARKVAFREIEDINYYKFFVFKTWRYTKITK